MIQQPRFMTQKSVGTTQKCLLTIQSKTFEIQKILGMTAASVYDTEKCGDDTKISVDDTAPTINTRKSIEMTQKFIS